MLDSMHNQSTGKPFGCMARNTAMAMRARCSHAASGRRWRTDSGHSGLCLLRCVLGIKALVCCAQEIADVLNWELPEADYRALARLPQNLASAKDQSPALFDGTKA